MFRILPEDSVKTKENVFLWWARPGTTYQVQGVYWNEAYSREIASLQTDLGEYVNTDVNNLEKCRV